MHNRKCTNPTVKTENEIILHCTLFSFEATSLVAKTLVSVLIISWLMNYAHLETKFT